MVRVSSKLKDLGRQPESSQHRFLAGSRSEANCTLQLSRVVLIMFLASIIEVVLWALAYLQLNAIEGFEPAVYFSMVTFTTLGYGDIVLHEGWRILASFEAINGIIMGGWTTAIVMWAVTRVYFTEHGKEPFKGPDA